MNERVSAVFSNGEEAREAVSWLEANGVPRDAISVVARDDAYPRGAKGGEAGTDQTAGDKAKDAGKGALAGAGIGAGVGALFGLAAAAIPGVGPFIAAGAFANALGVTGGAALSGAIVGGTSGGLASALTHAGLSKEESDYYAHSVEGGGVLVTVDAAQAGVSPQVVRDTFHRLHGQAASVA
jgi:hypothetical protein